MKLLFDEDVSPTLVQAVNVRGYEATSVRDRARLSQRDWLVRDLAVEEDRVIVTVNGDDFRQLLGNEPLHPGLIILRDATRQQAEQDLLTIIEYLEAQPDAPATYMVNRVIQLERDGTITDQVLPPL